MTDDAMKKLTLGDLERIAARFSAAVASIREGQQLLGGGHGTQRDAAAPVEFGHETAPPISDADAARLHTLRQFQPAEQPPRKSVLTSAEIRERDALLGRQRTQDLPTEIKEAMESAT